MPGKTNQKDTGCITQNKYVKFLIENYRDINSMKEILDTAEIKLPEIIDGYMYRTIDKAVCELNKEKTINVDFEIERIDDSICWYTNEMYNSNKKEGLFFGYDMDPNYWKNLCSKNREHYNYLQLCINGKGKNKSQRRQYITGWIKYFQRKQSVLSQNRVFLIDNTVEYVEEYEETLAYYLDKEISPEKLNDIENLEDDIKDAVKKFTKNMMKMIAKKNQNSAK